MNKSQSELNGMKMLTDETMRILSIGISTGGNAEIKMASQHPERRIIATTLDCEGLKSVKEKMSTSKLSSQIELRLEDISDSNLKYSGNQFDFVYARLVLHYLSAQKLSQALKNIHRVLKPESKVFIVVRSKNSPELKPEAIVFYDETTCLTTYLPESGSRRELTRYFHSQDSITTALSSNGFQVEDVTSFYEDLSPSFKRDDNVRIRNHLIQVVAKK